LLSAAVLDDQEVARYQPYQTQLAANLCTETNETEQSQPSEGADNNALDVATQAELA
jgi:hypothetical protein